MERKSGAARKQGPVGFPVFFFIQRLPCSAVGQGLGDVVGLHGFRSDQVGDGAGEPQHAAVAPGTQAKPLRTRSQQLFFLAPQRHHVVQAALPLLPAPGPRFRQEELGVDGIDEEVDVDAVEKGTRAA